MRDVVTFRSKLFNLTESRDYFINPDCFGDDLAKWLQAKLKSRGIEVYEKIGQEDFGWYFNYVVNDTAYCAVIGNLGREGWFLVIERNCGLIFSILGKRHRNISLAAISAVNAVLNEEPQITGIQWFYWTQFRKGRLENGALKPTG